ncbi:MAG: threonine ammonia-lyase [Eubacteriales bacterium]
MITIEKVKDAQRVLGNVVRHTQLIEAPRVNTECTVYLKPENLQLTGSFKVRGSAYKISQLTDEEKKHGVIACSAGNHAQGVALAATKNGIRSVICLPSSAPISKVEATKRYGAEVCLVDGVYDDAYTEALRQRDEKGYTFIHPFDDDDVIAGQGTIGLEILEEMPDIDAIVVPVGGGGLISGVAFAVKSINSNIKVYGVQAQGAPSMYNALISGKPKTLSSVSTFADGIAVKAPGANTFEYCRRYVDEIVTVTEDEIAAAILHLIENQKLIAEGAGAVAVAAVKFDKLPIKGKKVVCLVSGGNIDVTILSRVIDRGLHKSGRICSLVIELIDKPGQLEAVSRIIAACGGNIVSVHHEHGDADAVNGCFLRISMETKSFDHIQEIRSKLTESGFKLV